LLQSISPIHSSICSSIAICDIVSSMTSRFFRAGAGTVIYNQHGEIAIFKRAQHPVGVWELQQGGIDPGEHPKDAMWRELAEEIGLREVDVTLTSEVPGWTIYQNRDASELLTDILGQAHRWFFLELKPEVVIDISRASEDAVSEFCWTTFDDLIQRTGTHKQHIYQTLQSYFFTNIQKPLA